LLQNAIFLAQLVVLGGSKIHFQTIFSAFYNKSVVFLLFNSNLAFHEEFVCLCTDDDYRWPFLVAKFKYWQLANPHGICAGNRCL
jgi:hypothetical protein